MSFNSANWCAYNVQCLLSSIGKYVDRACANALKHGKITVSGFVYFHKNCRFRWKKIVSKTNLGTTIHYTYTSYNKYFRLWIVSEELRFNEIRGVNKKFVDCLYKIKTSWGTSVKFWTFLTHHILRLYNKLGH